MYDMYLNILCAIFFLLDNECFIASFKSLWHLFAIFLR